MLYWKGGIAGKGIYWLFQLLSPSRDPWWHQLGVHLVGGRLLCCRRSCSWRSTDSESILWHSWWPFHFPTKERRWDRSSLLRRKKKSLMSQGVIPFPWPHQTAQRGKCKGFPGKGQRFVPAATWGQFEDDSLLILRSFRIVGDKPAPAKTSQTPPK